MDGLRSVPLDPTPSRRRSMMDSCPRHTRSALLCRQCRAARKARREAAAAASSPLAQSGHDYLPLMQPMVVEGSDGCCGGGCCADPQGAEADRGDVRGHGPADGTGSSAEVSRGETVVTPPSWGYTSPPVTDYSPPPAGGGVHESGSGPGASGWSSSDSGGSSFGSSSDGGSINF